MYPFVCVRLCILLHSFYILCIYTMKTIFTLFRKEDQLFVSYNPKGEEINELLHRIAAEVELKDAKISSMIDWWYIVKNTWSDASDYIKENMRTKEQALQRMQAVKTLWIKTADNENRILLTQDLY